MVNTKWHWPPRSRKCLFTSNIDFYRPRLAKTKKTKVTIVLHTFFDYCKLEWNKKPFLSRCIIRLILYFNASLYFIGNTFLTHLINKIKMYISFLRKFQNILLHWYVIAESFQYDCVQNEKINLNQDSAKIIVIHT